MRPTCSFLSWLTSSSAGAASATSSFEPPPRASKNASNSPPSANSSEEETDDRSEVRAGQRLGQVRTSPKQVVFGWTESRRVSSDAGKVTSDSELQKLGHVV